MTIKFKKTPINGLYVIENILTDEECNFYLNKAHEKGWEFVDRGIADYDRSIIINEEWAEKLYQKIKKYIPIEIDDVKIIGLNDHFRFSKYYEGGRFEKHTDGTNIDKNGNRSIMTLNIFLNDIEDGGGTIFYEDDIKIHVKAVKGRAALFNKYILHEGEKVKQNYKYLMRTDLMGIDKFTFL